MTSKLIRFLMAGLFLWLTAAPTVLAQGGCPAQLPATYEYTIVQVVELATPRSEQPAATSPYTFVDVDVTLTVEAGQRVFLSSSPDSLAPTCVDDYLRLESETGQLLFDYRSPDRSRIEARDGLETEITPLLKPGPNRIRLRLVDVGQVYSSSYIYAVVVAGLAPPPPTRTARTPTPTVVTPEPTATTPFITTATVTVQPTATLTKAVSVFTQEPPQTPPTGTLEVLRWPPILPTLALLGLGLGLLWLLRRRLKPAGTLPGEIEIYKAGRYVKTLVLAEFNKAIITLGSGAMDISLPGEGVLPQAAQLFSKVIEGQRQPVLVIFEPDGTVQEERQLHHQDNVYLGDYRLVYKNLTEEAPFYLIGEFNNA